MRRVAGDAHHRWPQVPDLCRRCAVHAAGHLPGTHANDFVKWRTLPCPLTTVCFLSHAEVATTDIIASSYCQS